MSESSKQFTDPVARREDFAQDFEVWARCCVRIPDKLTGQLVPFVLNEPQRKMLRLMEQQRRAGKPVRVMLLKARQWGGSTLTQIYIAWHQLVLYKGRNSVIIGHKRNSSSNIKAMLRKIVEHYPAQYLDNPDEPMTFVSDRDAPDVQEIAQRDAKVILTSSFSADAARGYNLSFAHLSEVAFWADNKAVSPSDIIRSVTGTIPLTAGTVIVLESTANGSNSWWYNEWRRAMEGKSVFTPLFIGWQDNPIYTLPCPAGFVPDERERELLDMGLTDNQVYWYHCKRMEVGEPEQMMAEFPTTPDEAFSSTTHPVFSPDEAAAIMATASQPLNSADAVDVWSSPEAGQQYVTLLSLGNDIGQCQRESICSVWRCDNNNNNIELAAQLRSGEPLGLLGDKVLKLCNDYNRAMLVVANYEMQPSVTDKDKAKFLIDIGLLKYRNLYRDRKNGDRFLTTTRENYSLMFYELIFAERNGIIADHDSQACKAISEIIVHANQRYYVSDNNDFSLVLNRAQMLYCWRQINAMKKKYHFSRDEVLMCADNMIDSRFV